MCTIVILRNVLRDAPLVIAANRDEFYARAATTPRVVSNEPRAVAGIDGQKGGTWMGVTEDGFFVGLTNQRPTVLPDPSLRSRGEIALELLRLGSSDAALEKMSRLDGAEYNAFNILFGDARSLHVAYVRRDAATQIEQVPDGVHVLPNDVLDSPSFPKVARAHALADAAREGIVSSARGPEWLGDHQRAPLETLAPPPPGLPITREFQHALSAICVHTETYGTRSATLAVLVPGAVRRYLFASGPPCTTPFEDLTSLVTTGAP